MTPERLFKSYLPSDTSYKKQPPVKAAAIVRWSRGPVTAVTSAGEVRTTFPSALAIASALEGELR